MRRKQRSVDEGSGAAPVFEGLEPRVMLAGSVIINEFMADNTKTLKDSFAQYPDWIELYNPGDAALNLGGWYLTDSAANLTEWPLPSVSLAAKGYLVVFASGRDVRVAPEYHTNFKLDAQGEYLALVRGSDGFKASEFNPYPAQEQDVSYGLHEDFNIATLVGPDTTGRVLIPTVSSPGAIDWRTQAYSDAAWPLSGPGGYGFQANLPGLAVWQTSANLYVDSLATADSILATPSKQIGTLAENAASINYYNTGGGGNYASNRAFPGTIINTEADNFVLRAVGTLAIPAAGAWTFNVNSDDGFRLTITGATVAGGGNAISYATGRGAADTSGVFTFPAAGNYDLELIMFQGNGGAEVELSAAQGSYGAWTSANFHLVGDTASGGLAVSAPAVTGSGATGSLAGLIATDLTTAMYKVNASAYLRLTFNVDNPAAYTSLTLRMQYDDGFVAYLNGHQIAARNAPGSPGWNSTATGTHEAAVNTYEDIDVTATALPYLQMLGNVLAIQGLNLAATDADFLVRPALDQITSLGLQPRYFDVATPGKSNSDGVVAFVGDTKFDHDRGFYTAPFDVAITTTTPGATICYTTDGSTPTTSHGTVYTAPIHVTKTTTLRAMAYKAGYQATDVDTQTYIFLANVLTQTGAGFPTTWGGVTADYEMDPNVVNVAPYNATLLNDLKALPSMSIVMDVNDMFGPSGLYSNPGTEDLEKAGSLELIYPDGTQGFQINAGFRMNGGVGRDPSVKRHSFRVLFKSQYGDSQLQYPLFADSPVDEFNTIILRANFNDGWNNMSWGGRSQYIRDEWYRETELALGQPAPHGTFVNLYINGLYWGLYNPTERPDASFDASYFGGTKDQYDAFNSGQLLDGNTTAWNQMFTIARAGLASTTQYQALQQYLDVTNLADYFLLNFYVGNWDWDGHNWYAGRLEAAGAGLKMLPWDGEWTLDTPGKDYTTVNNSGNPSEIFQDLRANSDFLTLFADRVYKAFFNGGALSETATAARYQALATLIDRAIVGESARWGDLTTEPPYTRDTNWVPEKNRLLSSYFPQNTSAMLALFRSRGLYPAVDAPIFSQNGGTIPSGFTVTLSGLGTIYYTLDGSDPRAAGGAVSASARLYSSPLVLNQSALLRARVYNSATGVWSALHEAPFVLNTPPALRISEVMYHAADPTPPSAYTNDSFDFVELCNTGTQTLHLSGVRLAGDVTFTFGALDLAAGQFIVVAANTTAFVARYGATPRLAGTYTGTLGNTSGHVQLIDPLAGQVIDAVYQDSWYYNTDGEGFSLVIRDPASTDVTQWGSKDGWRPSNLVNGSPGAADNQGVTVLPGAIVVNELLSHTDVDPPGDWVELKNLSTTRIDLSGWYLSDHLDDPKRYQIAANTWIEAGGLLVFTQRNHFANVADPGCHTPFGYSELGGDVVLSQATSAGALAGFRIDQPFGAADREVSFVRYVKSTGGVDFVASTASTRGQENAPPLVGPVVLNEMMYHPAGAAGVGDEWIELYNLTSAPALLYDPARPQDRWKFTDGVDFTFPASASIPAHGYALVVPLDPAAFRAKYSVPAGVAIFGPYANVLDDGGETVELSKPGDPEPDGTVPYYRVDRLTYGDSTPWPVEADGAGATLARWTASAYGNDVANWGRGTTGGTPGSANLAFDNSPPTVPTGLTATITNSARVDLAWQPAVDPQSYVAGYHIFRNGVLLNTTTTAGFSDATVQAGYTYSYQVTAFNHDGAESAKSAAALVAIIGIAAASTPANNTVRIQFSDLVDRDAAQLLTNYTVTAGGGAALTVTGAILQPDLRTVLVTVSPVLALGTTYTITITNQMLRGTTAGVPPITQNFAYAPIGTGTILCEYWSGVAGATIASLTGNSSYPNYPTGRYDLNQLEGSTNWADSYGTRIRGYVTAPATGSYTFYVAGDDAAELYLSTSELPSGATRIAYTSTATGSREWTKSSTQQSAAITLTAGQRYYIEVLHKENTGTDNVAVAWKLPSGTLEGPIAGAHLSPYLLAADTTVSLQVVGYLANETGPGRGTVRFNRSGNLGYGLTIFYTVTGTASGKDYVEDLTGSLLLPAGATYMDLAITPVDDALNEFDETLSFTLLADRTYSRGAFTGNVVIQDNELGTVTGIDLNGRAGAGPQAVEPTDRGVQTLGVTFSEPVTFAAGDITLQTVANPGTGETLGTLITPTSVTGSGTSTMTITLPAGAAMNTWVKVTLAAYAIKDLQNHMLDGDAKPGGSGKGFLFDKARDLPSGNGYAGGNAVFYLGSLRGDLTGDAHVDRADRLVLASHYRQTGALGALGLVGDLNLDGVIDIIDLTLLSAQMGQPMGATSQGASPTPAEAPAAPAEAPAPAPAPAADTTAAATATRAVAAAAAPMIAFAALVPNPGATIRRPPPPPPPGAPPAPGAPTPRPQLAPTFDVLAAVGDPPTGGRGPWRPSSSAADWRRWAQHADLLQTAGSSQTADADPVLSSV